jgi:hypothetical protein
MLFPHTSGSSSSDVMLLDVASVKRGVRKKVKKGLISPGGSRMSRGSWGDATGSANMLSGFLGKSKRQTSQGPVIDPVDALRNSA